MHLLIMIPDLPGNMIIQEQKLSKLLVGRNNTSEVWQIWMFFFF